MNMELENDSTDDLELKFENEFLRQLVFDSNKQNEYTVDEIRYTCLSYFPEMNWIYSYKRTESGIEYVYAAGDDLRLKYFPGDPYVKFIIEKNRIFLKEFKDSFSEFKIDINHESLKKTKKFNSDLNSCFEKIKNKCNLRNWKSSYVNRSVNDGESWDIEITFNTVYGKRVLHFEGVNEWPPKFYTFVDFMDKPLKLYGLI